MAAKKSAKRPAKKTAAKRPAKKSAAKRPAKKSAAKRPAKKSARPRMVQQWLPGLDPQTNDPRRLQRATQKHPELHTLPEVRAYLAGVADGRKKGRR